MLGAWALTQAYPVLAQADPGVELLRIYGGRIAHVQTVGESFDGEHEAVATGSGFLVADDLVVTADHVLPANDGRYKAQVVNVRLGSKEKTARAGTVLVRDPVRDLALIRIAPVPTPIPHCPVSALRDPALAPAGIRLFVLSYPLDEDLTINDGLLRNHATPARWRTNALLTSGDSGGAVFSDKGYVIGVAVGGVTEWQTVDGERRAVFGMNYIIPVASLAESPVGAAIVQGAGAACWEMPAGPNLTLASLPSRLSTLSGTLAGLVGTEPSAPSAAGTSAPASTDMPSVPTSGGTSVPDGSEPPPRETVTRTYTVETMKDDHGLGKSRRDYPPLVIEAASGYRIDACEFAAHSANNESGVACAIESGGGSATFRYALTSGPLWDRWRGWLSGRIVVRQSLR